MGRHDPITDIAAMKMLYPVAVQAAPGLGVDPDMVTQLQTAIPQILDFPRTDKATHKLVKTAADDNDGNTVLGFSADQSAAQHNVENLDLEPVWPYNLIGDTSPLFGLAQTTYNSRLFRNSNSWTYDPVDAARLDMGDQVAATLKASASRWQVYPSGMAAWNTGSLQEPYDEHSGVTTLAVNEALATDYDGLLRIGPAVPTGWDMEGTISLQNQSKLHVQIQGGTVTTAVIESGLRPRHPGPQPVEGQGHPGRRRRRRLHRRRRDHPGRHLHHPREGRQGRHHPAAVGPARRARPSRR